jgi:hypothetical protein
MWAISYGGIREHMNLPSSELIKVDESKDAFCKTFNTNQVFVNYSHEGAKHKAHH